MSDAPQTSDDRKAARAEEVEKQVRKFRKLAAGVVDRTCPLCGYHGPFTAYGDPPRLDARCGGCESLERHRLMKLFFERTDFLRPGLAILHFAPEYRLMPLLRKGATRYETADLAQSRRVTHHIDITQTGLPDAEWDRVICNHVLEHVDDSAALAEIFRLLKPGGCAMLTTPICEGWSVTYENPQATSFEDRRLHHGQKDHVRYYGRDFRDRIRAAGFMLGEFTAVEPDVHRHGLMRGETLFIATRPEGAT